MTVAYPETKLILGRYLGPGINIGPAMNAKIIKANGRYVHRSTLQGLTQDEIDNPEEKKSLEEFDSKITKNLGPHAKPSDFAQSDINVEESNDLYKDEEQDGTGAPYQDDLDEKYFNMYVGAEVLLPLENSMQSGKVKRRRLNLGSNPIGKGN